MAQGLWTDHIYLSLESEGLSRTFRILRGVFSKFRASAWHSRILNWTKIDLFIHFKFVFIYLVRLKKSPSEYINNLLRVLGECVCVCILERGGEKEKFRENLSKNWRDSIQIWEISSNCNFLNSILLQLWFWLSIYVCFHQSYE